MKPKILFIHPPLVVDLKLQKGLKYPPLGAAFISAYVRSYGYQVKIFDGCVEKKPWKKLESIIDSFSPEIVCLSFTSLLAESAYLAAEQIKKNNPDIIILAGGYHPSVMAEEVIKNKNIDFVFVGEGEQALLEWLEIYTAKANDYSSIKGLVYFNKGFLTKTGSRPMLDDIDSLPLPAYDLLPLSKYSSMVSTRKPYVTFIRSRGCPFRCTFCGVQMLFGRRYRCQSPDKTISDIEELISRFKVKEILFKDSDFMIDLENVKELSKRFIDRKFDLIWSCNARVDRVNKDILALMYRAGCKMITYGVESGNQTILNNLKKDITIAQIKEAIRITKEAGILTTVNIIFGSPGETAETITQTLNFVKELDPDYGNFAYLTAFPGSDLYQDALANGWFIGGKPCSYGYEQLRLNATDLSDIELSKTLSFAVKSFYLRRAYILKRIKDMSFSDFCNNIKGFFTILKN
ncbi:MAG: radical SAM protein [Candidatus Omnitrophica bacterium]|nr:radical SAM protein [Candidatus Omnitrophota bacterium]